MKSTMIGKIFQANVGGGTFFPNGHEGVFYGDLHGDPELSFFLDELGGTPFKNLWGNLQDLQRKVQLES